MNASITLDEEQAMPRPSHAQVAQLAREHGRTVFIAAYRVLGRQAEAEDVQQDVFMKLLERPPAQVESWPAMLTTLAVRMAIDRHRRQRRWQRLLPAWIAQTEHAAESAERHADRSLQADRLRQAVRRLRKRDAECFTLRCIEGMDIGLIAETTGMTANHVSVCLHRATRTLNTLLDESGAEAEEKRA